MKNYCSDSISDFQNETDYEVVKIKKNKAICVQCEKATESKAETGVPIAVISCEGACLQGEISRRVANNICFSEIPEQSFRICLGGAFTKDTNQRKLVRNSQRVFVLEGCGISCSSRMMKGVIPDLQCVIIFVNNYYKVDNNKFSIKDLPEEEIQQISNQATEEILEEINKSKGYTEEIPNFNCCS